MKLSELRRIEEGKATVYGVLEFEPRLGVTRRHAPKPAEACCPTAMAWHGVRRPSPYPASACCPHCKKSGGMVDPGPEAVEKELYHPADMRPHTKRLQCGALSGAGSRRLLPSWSKSEKDFLRPNPPNRGAATTRWKAGTLFPDAEGQAISKATPC